MTAATTRFSGRACSVQQVTLSREIVRVAALNAPATAAAQRGPSASHSGAATATARTRCAPAPSGSSPNRAVAHSAALPDQVPYGAEAAFAEAKAFLCSREARQMSESDLERELYRRGQELVHKLLQGHLEQRSPREAAGPVDTTAGGRRPRSCGLASGRNGSGRAWNGSRGRWSPRRRWKPSARTPSRSSAGVTLVAGAETQLDLVDASAAYGVDVTVVLDIIHMASRSIPAPTTCRSTRRICTTTATSRRAGPLPPASSKGRAGTSSATEWS